MSTHEMLVSDHRLEQRRYGALPFRVLSRLFARCIELFESFDTAHSPNGTRGIVK